MFRLFKIPPKAMQAGAALPDSVNVPRPFHSEYNASREEQTMELRNGCNLGFAEYGDLKGLPLIFLHGSPGSRYDGQGFHKVAKKLGIHLICPERPGYGLSQCYPGLNLSQYPSDILQLARHLNLPRYHVMGISGGAPYAIACAHKLPSEELLGAAVLVGQGHPNALTLQTEGVGGLVALFAARWAPGLIRAATNHLSLGDPDPVKFEKSFKQLLTVFSADERKQILSPEMLPTIKASLRAAYANGVGGSVRDMQMSARPWDFELESVQKKIMLIYGHKDTRTPLSFGRYYQAHLPHAELIEYEDLNHCDTHRDEEILSRIIGKWENPSNSGSDSSTQ